MNIEKIIKNIIGDGAGLVYTDTGSGSGGPGYINPETLAEMLGNGEFSDAKPVPLDNTLMIETFKDMGLDSPVGAMNQIEFNFGDNNYRQISWIWE